MSEASALKTKVKLNPPSESCNSEGPCCNPRPNLSNQNMDKTGQSGDAIDLLSLYQTTKFWPSPNRKHLQKDNTLLLKG